MSLQIKGHAKGIVFFKIGRGDCPHWRKVIENWINAAFYYGLRSEILTRKFWAILSRFYFTS